MNDNNRTQKESQYPLRRNGLSAKIGTEKWLLKNGTVIDGENLTARQADVRIENGMITETGEGLSADGCTVMDCTGRVVTAGFIDSHVHVESSMVLPAAFGEAVLPHGTTAIIADPHEIVNVAGADGLSEFLNEAGEAPIDIFVCIPSSVPATPYDTNGAGKFTAADMARFADLNEIVGLGEVMCYYDVADRNPEIMDKIALFADKTIDGHTAGMPSELLDSYIQAGVQNDHECSDPESMMQRYDKGMNIYIREGSAARNAMALLTCAAEQGLAISRLAFCTDDKHLATIAQEGHISYIVRMARRLGFGWGETARMASYNPCRYYRLEKRGNIRPGYIADIVVTDDACEHIFHVFKNGILAATDSKLSPTVRQADMRNTRSFANTVKFRELSADDFIVPEKLRNTAMELVDGQLLTRKITVTDDEAEQLPLLATVERYGKNGNLSVCLLKGYGIRNGAVATSVSHDSHNVVCAGDNGTDMAVACNRLRQLGGGYVIASGGKVTGELPLPAYGLMAVKDAKTTSEAIDRLEKIAHGMGVNPNIDAFTTLSFTALPVIPALRLLDTGLFDVEKGSFITGE